MQSVIGRGGMGQEHGLYQIPRIVLIQTSDAAPAINRRTINTDKLHPRIVITRLYPPNQARRCCVFAH